MHGFDQAKKERAALKTRGFGSIPPGRVSE
jgi:hypothetical protein